MFLVDGIVVAIVLSNCWFYIPKIWDVIRGGTFHFYLRGLLTVQYSFFNPFKYRTFVHCVIFGMGLEQQQLKCGGFGSYYQFRFPRHRRDKKALVTKNRGGLGRVMAA